MDASLLTAILAATGGIAGLVGLLRFIAFRRVESRQLSASADLVESQIRTQEAISQFGMVNNLLDRYERRSVALELRIDEQDKQIAELRAELAVVCPRAKLADILEHEIARIQDRLDAAESLLREHGLAAQLPVPKPAAPRAELRSTERKESIP